MCYLTNFPSFFLFPVFCLCVCLFVSFLVIILVWPSNCLIPCLALFLFVYCFASMDSMSNVHVFLRMLGIIRHTFRSCLTGVVTAKHANNTFQHKLGKPQKKSFFIGQATKREGGGVKAGTLRK